VKIALPPSASTLVMLAALVSPTLAQTPQPVLSTDAISPARFVSAHGQRALLMGYSGAGLEAWTYPFQLFTNYRLQIVPAGATSAIDADAILQRIEVRPDSTTRIYVGPDFTVREQLYVPLDQPGVILSYQVEGRRAIDLRVTFLPVLDLMWPAGVGGQDLRWSDPLSGYEVWQATTGYRAIIASPQAIAHSDVVNSTHREDFTQSVLLRPSHGAAEVFATLEEASAPDGSALRTLQQQEPTLRAASLAHIEAVLAHGIQIHTPDENLNRAIENSRLALDEAWVCNPRIGCGETAGYGPSRPMRRPQYAWFFAGDGMVATEALLATSDTDRARDELNFILKYQNPANGMIWHEISQSAGFIDWAGKYPYMYVHIDLSFDFLSTVADYYLRTGDIDFLRHNWDHLAAAWSFCRSLVNPATALPQIPAGKEGGNEQDRMREDVGLSATWVSAADAFRQIALATGHNDEAAAASQAADAARKALAARYWNAQSGYWIAGFNVAGAPMTDQRAHPGLFGRGFIPAAQEDTALDRLAGSDFETDWGTRSMSSQSARFDPDSYAAGSVSALLTADTSEAFWRDHRPAIASSVFESLLPWLQLDSLGHVHEVAAGDVWHPQVESVPEQTWSSAGLLHAAIRGLLGIDVDAPQHRLTLAPHLDPHWGEVSIAQIAVGTAQVAATLDQKSGELDATFTAQGGNAHLTFAPEIPLGATAVHALVDEHATPVTLDQHDEDAHARVEIDLTHAPTHCRILYSGGVRISVPATYPALGAASRQVKLTAVHLAGHQLTLYADIAGQDDAFVDLQTPWKIEAVHGGAAARLDNDWYRVTFAASSASSQPGYAHRSLTIDLGPAR
jgi:glycogen debranching enzyme